MNTIQVQHQPKLDIQAIGVEMNVYLERKIQNLIRKISLLLPEINWIDIYLKANHASINPCTVTVRMGIPGTDIIATDSGDRWKIILRNIEKRVIRQLEKRKALTLKPTSS